MSADFLNSYAASGVYTKQGRFGPPVDGHYQSFPRTTWEVELKMLSEIPAIRGVEWMYDLYGEGFNPIESVDGREYLRKFLKSVGLEVASVCADYFMDCPFLRCTEEHFRQRRERLRWLIDVCPEIGVDRIILPFLDASSIKTIHEREIIIECLRTVLPLAQDRGVHLSLETDLSPESFRKLLLDIDHPMIGVNYDMGNSAAAGFDPREEFEAYGDWIISVHVKDRLRGSCTVPLGDGDVDFPLIRELLLKNDYRGDIVMEAARGPVGQELTWQARMAYKIIDWLRGGVSRR